MFEILNPLVLVLVFCLGCLFYLYRKLTQQNVRLTNFILSLKDERAEIITRDVEAPKTKDPRVEQSRVFRDIIDRGTTNSKELKKVGKEMRLV